MAQQEHVQMGKWVEFICMCYKQTYSTHILFVPVTPNGNFIKYISSFFPI